MNVPVHPEELSGEGHTVADRPTPAEISLPNDSAARERPAFPRQRNPALPIYVAGLLYTISLHKFVFRDPLASGTGFQGLLETLCLLGGFLCVAVYTRTSQRTHRFSPGVICFTIFGVFALCSSWRSFNPTLSFAKGVLFLIVVTTAYLVNQAGVAEHFFLAIYRSYIAILVAGLFVGLLLPSVYPLVTIDEFSGRTKLAVFGTSAGTLGEDTLLLLLISPLLRGRVGWISQIFLFVFNVLTGGKTATALLCFFLLMRFFLTVPNWRSWRGALTVFVTACLLAVATLSTISSSQYGAAFAAPGEAFYGTHVGDEAKTFNGRTTVWMASIDLLPDVPLLGFGFNGVRDIMVKTVSWAGNSHNGYLEMALTSGFVGFAFLIGGVASVAISCFRTRPPERLYLGMILVCILITNGIGSTFSEPSYFGTLLLIWLYYEAHVHKNNGRHLAE